MHVGSIPVKAAADRDEPVQRGCRNAASGRTALLRWLARWSERHGRARVLVVSARPLWPRLLANVNLAGRATARQQEPG